MAITRRTGADRTNMWVLSTKTVAAHSTLSVEVDEECVKQCDLAMFAREHESGHRIHVTSVDDRLLAHWHGMSSRSKRGKF